MLISSSLWHWNWGWQGGPTKWQSLLLVPVKEVLQIPKSQMPPKKIMNGAKTYTDRLETSVQTRESTQKQLALFAVLHLLVKYNVPSLWFHSSSSNFNYFDENGVQQWSLGFEDARLFKVITLMKEQGIAVLVIGDWLAFSTKIGVYLLKLYDYEKGLTKSALFDIL